MTEPAGLSHQLRHQSTALIRRLRQEWRWALHLLLPPACFLCHHPLSAEETGLCQRCLTDCQIRPPAACIHCGEPFRAASSVNHRCTRCQQDPPPFDNLLYAGLYQGALKQAIQQFKYHNQPRLAHPLGRLLSTRCLAAMTDFQPDAIIPVPLHPDRLRKRGFNQSLQLARVLSRELTCPISATLLLRNRPTPPLKDLRPFEREAVLRHCFTVQHNISPRRIVLVDDIVTTTATVRACSNQLVQQGHRVLVVSLARAPREST
ncbi:MAG: ComF family protein [Desulfuromonadaceae bacterium]|nr:ComF family protein [Desulfuromonadaceae bacterium]